MTGLTGVAILVLWDDQAQNGNTSSLVMGGNRLDTTNFALNYRSFLQGGAGRYFFSVATIALVSRCVASGNMLTNEGVQVAIDIDVTVEEAEFDRVSLILDAVGSIIELSEGGETAIAGPATQLSVAGNVLQGVVYTFPPKDPTVLSSINGVTN
jgi:hypothetical protein